MKEVLKGYCTIWYHLEGIAKILSLSNVQNKYKVMYDNTLNQGFVVRMADGNTRVLGPSKNKIFFTC